MQGIKCMACGEIIPIMYDTVEYSHERFMLGERFGLSTEEIKAVCPICQIEYTIKGWKENVKKIKESLNEQI